ncbi:MAG: PspA/IM30 family protein [bacterium]
MKLLGSIQRWLTAKDSEYSEKIEKGHEVDFAKQDLEKMRQDMSQITKNLGTIKSTIVRLRRESAEYTAAREQHERDALSLMQAGKEGLAQKHAAKIALLEENIGTLAVSIKQQEGLLEGQKSQRDKFAKAISEAENSMKLMESMNAVAQATEKITSVKLPGTTNALASFKDRQRRIQTRLDQAKSLQEYTEESSEGDMLEKETARALGNSKGNEVLARLRLQLEHK